MIAILTFFNLAWAQQDVVELSRQVAHINLNTSQSPDVIAKNLRLLNQADKNCDKASNQDEEDEKKKQSALQVSCQFQFLTDQKIEWTFSEVTQRYDMRSYYQDEARNLGMSFEDYMKKPFNERLNATKGWGYWGPDGDFKNLYEAITANKTYFEHVKAFDELMATSTLAERNQVYASLAHQTLREKLLFAQILGQNSVYNDAMAADDLPQTDRGAEAMVKGMQTGDGNLSGVCTHQGLLNAEALTGMGIDKKDVQIVGYVTASGIGHILNKVTDKDEIYTVNWGNLYTNKRQISEDYMIRDADFTATGVAVNIFDIDGKMVATKNLPLGDYLADVSNQNQLFMDPVHRLGSTTNKAEVKNRYLTPGIFWGKTSAGDEIKGIRLNKDLGGFKNSVVVYESVYLDGTKEDVDFNIGSKGFYFNHGYLKEFKPVIINSKTGVETAAGYNMQGQYFDNSINYKFKTSGHTATDHGSGIDGALQVPIKAQVHYKSPDAKISDLKVGGAVEFSPGLKDARDPMNIGAYRPMLNKYTVYSSLTDKSGKLTVDNTYYVIPGIHQSLIDTKASYRVVDKPNLKVTGSGEVIHNLGQGKTVLVGEAEAQFRCFSGTALQTDMTVNYRAVASQGNSSIPGQQLSVCVRVGR